MAAASRVVGDRQTGERRTETETINAPLDRSVGASRQRSGRSPRGAMPHALDSRRLAESARVERRGGIRICSRGEKPTIMKTIGTVVTLEGLLLITSLLPDQLLQGELTNPKCQGDPAKPVRGKELVLRLTSMARRISGLAVAGSSKHTSSHLSSSRNRAPNAL